MLCPFFDDQRNEKYKALATLSYYHEKSKGEKNENQKLFL